MKEFFKKLKKKETNQMIIFRIYHGDYINTINKYELFLKINNKCELIDFKRWSSQPIFYPHFSIYSKKLYKEFFFSPDAIQSIYDRFVHFILSDKFL